MNIVITKLLPADSYTLGMRSTTNNGQKSFLHDQNRVPSTWTKARLGRIMDATFLLMLRSPVVERRIPARKPLSPVDESVSPRCRRCIRKRGARGRRPRQGGDRRNRAGFWTRGREMASLGVHSPEQSVEKRLGSRLILGVILEAGGIVRGRWSERRDVGFVSQRVLWGAGTGLPHEGYSTRNVAIVDPERRVGFRAFLG